MFSDSDSRLNDLLNQNEEFRKEFNEKFKIRKEPRITFIGKILRKTSFAEIAQFINVIMGNMSIIDPRPVVEDEKKRYWKEINRLLSVKPGITGLWQVKGRSNIDYTEWKKLDIYYAKNFNIYLDFYIYLKTIFIILFPFNKGAF